MFTLQLAGQLPILIVACIALATAQLIVRDNTNVQTHKFASIDGLRGFLALLVFIHHSDYWFYYSHQKGWIPSGTVLYTNLGQSSICLFFMLSGFLFSYKLLEARSNPVDWLKLYCSRFLRLTPLYLTLVALIIGIVIVESHFTLQEDVPSLIQHISKWIFFTAQGHPDINAHKDTHLITAGVVWTLPYEWYFYFSLPVLGVLLGAKNNTNNSLWLILSCFIILSFNLDKNLLYGFAGGGIAAFIAWKPNLRKFFQHKLNSIIVVIGLIVSYKYIDGYVTGMTYLRLFILTLCMAYIACGASLFGLLTCRAARALSTISYGVYLLHGIVLYIVVMHVLPASLRTSFSEQQHWYLVFICTPLILAAATASWYIIERPAINSTNRLTLLLRKIYPLEQR